MQAKRNRSAPAPLHRCDVQAGRLNRNSKSGSPHYQGGEAIALLATDSNGFRGFEAHRWIVAAVGVRSHDVPCANYWSMVVDPIREPGTAPMQKCPVRLRGRYRVNGRTLMHQNCKRLKLSPAEKFKPDKHRYRELLASVGQLVLGGIRNEPTGHRKKGASSAMI